MPTLDEQLCFALHAASRVVTRAYAERLAAYGARVYVADGQIDECGALVGKGANVPTFAGGVALPFVTSCLLIPYVLSVGHETRASPALGGAGVQLGASLEGDRPQASPLRGAVAQDSGQLGEDGDRLAGDRRRRPRADRPSRRRPRRERRPRRPGDPSALVASNRKIGEVLGWRDVPIDPQELGEAVRQWRERRMTRPAIPRPARGPDIHRLGRDVEDPAVRTQNHGGLALEPVASIRTQGRTFFMVACVAAA